MRQRATVEATCEDRAVVSVRRESACSGDCHKCAGCGAVTQTIQIRARNLIGAQKGDRIYLESKTSVVLWAVILVYLIPVVGFLAGYFIGYIIQAVAVCSVVGFLLGWLPALFYNRRIKKKPPTYFIVGFVEDSYRN